MDDLHQADLVLSRANDRPHEGSVTVIAGSAATSAVVVADLRAERATIIAALDLLFTGI